MKIDSAEFYHGLRNDDVDTLRRALRSGYSVDTALERFDEPPLCIAVASKSNNCVNELIKLDADTEQRDECGNTPLIIAAEICWLDGVKLLLKAGASAKASDDHGRTALFKAVGDLGKERLEIVRLLINADADVNAAMTNQVVSVLTNAAAFSSSVILSELIAARANIDSSYKKGTALIRAVEENRPDNVVVLLAAGADPTICKSNDSGFDFRGMTALEIAKAKKLKKIVTLLENAGQPSAAKPATVPIAPVADSWKRIEAALKKQRRLTKVKLNKGSSSPAMQKLAKQWSVNIPEDFLASYQLHDGQADDAEDLIPSLTGDEFGSTYQLLGLNEIDREWSMWKELVDGGEFEGTTSGPDKGIRDDWWSPGWIPFASNGGGDSICLDLNPAKGGKAGQVITMNHESSERRLLADSFAEWLADLAESLDESN